MGRVQTQIDRVTLFKNGALVERTGNAPSGRVEVDGLPLLLSWSTLRLRPSRGQVRNVVERAKVELSDGEAADADHAALDRLYIRTQTLSAMIKSYKELEQALAYAAEAGPLDDTISRSLKAMPHWGDIPQWIEHEARRLSEARAHVQREWTDASREYDREKMRARRVEAPARASRGVVFDLDTGEGESPFTLEYFVPAARWVPTYALDLEGDRGQLTLFAMVANATGEPWAGARLSFSTVDLARDTTLPEVLSWRIGRAQDKRRPAFRPLPSGFDALFDAYDRGKTRATDVSSGPPGGSPPPPAAKPAPAPAPRGPDRMLSRSGAPPPQVSLGGMDDPIDELEDLADEDEMNFESEMAFDEVSGSTLNAFATEDTDRLEMAALPRMSMAAAPPAPAAPGGGGPMRKRAKGSFGGAPVETIQAGGSEALPPSLRTMSMRLRGPEEASRGRLMPMNEREHMLSLVGAQEADAVRRALTSLERAAQGMLHSPLPHGTQPLDDATPPTIFIGQARTSVPDDGEYHRVAVHQMDAEGQAELRTVPRESTDVFRFFLFDLEPGVALPDGPLDVSEGGTFRVRSRLVTTGTSRRLQLNLGVEPQLRVLGRVARVRQEEKGLMSSASVVEHTVELTLRNTLDTSVRLRVFDRLPAPDQNEKDIEVALTHSAPPANRTDKGPDGRPLEGGMEWSLVVESGETLKVEHAYQIRLPAKTEVVGGNRRE